MADLVLSAAPLSLAGLDSVEAPELVAFVREDERPLAGLAGYADWRLCGELTRALLSGLFVGRAGERLLTVAGGRLPARRIFVFGAGTRASLKQDALAPLLREALGAVARAGGREVALSLPAVTDLAPSAAARILVEVAREVGLSRLVLHAEDEREADRALAVAAETFSGVRLLEPQSRSIRAAG